MSVRQRDDRQAHDRALELAATAVDFDLSAAETAELAAHLTTCPTCARSVAALRADARALSRPLTLLPSAHVDEAVHAAIAGRRPRPQRFLLLAAAALLLLTMLGAVAVGAYLLRLQPSVPTTVTPTQPVAVVSPHPDASPIGVVDATVRVTTGDTLPIKADEVAVAMAIGPAGSLYATVGDGVGSSGRTVIALLGPSGRPRAGWPITIEGGYPCDAPLPAGDGSIRIICRTPGQSGEQLAVTDRAFAFAPDGTPLAGWPVDLPDVRRSAGRVIGDELRFVAVQEPTDGDTSENSSHEAWMTGIGPDGVVRNGAHLQLAQGCCARSWLVGPAGDAFLVDYPSGTASEQATTQILGIDMGGAKPGWPATIDGVASEPAFGPDGRLYATVGSPRGGSARLVVLDATGHTVPGSSAVLPVPPAARSSSKGRGDEPAPPTVATDGTAFVLSDQGGTTVFAVGPDGVVRPDWPYLAADLVQWQGRCADAGVDCDRVRAPPSVGADDVLYLLSAPPDADSGGIATAIGADRRVRPGWPVILQRPGSVFDSIVAGPDGTTYALAVEPEAGGGYSSTVLAIDAASTVRYRTTILEP